MKKYFVFDNNLKQWGSALYTAQEIFRFPNATTETLLCSQDGTQTFTLAEMLKGENPTDATKRSDDNEERRSISKIVDLAELPTTCRLIRIVCRIVIFSHIIAIASGIGAGIGCLFRNANAELGAAIGGAVGFVACAVVLKKMENKRKKE